MCVELGIRKIHPVPYLKKICPLLDIQTFEGTLYTFAANLMDSDAVFDFLRDL